MAVWRDGALSFEIAEFLGMLIGLESRCQSIGENAINPMIAHPIESFDNKLARAIYFHSSPGNNSGLYSKCIVSK
jgi:hypothetical protein